MDDVLVPEKQGGGSNTNVNNASGNRLTGDLNQGLERVAMSLGKVFTARKNGVFR